MLSDNSVKRHLIKIPPSPRKVDFFGVYFFEYFHQFFSLGEIKNSGEILGLTGPYWLQIGRLSANCGQKTTIEFSKIWFFFIFWEIFELFEFNIRFGPKLRVNH